MTNRLHVQQRTHNKSAGGHRKGQLRVKRGKLVQPEKIGVHLLIMGIFNDVQTQIQMRRCDSVQSRL